MLRNMYMYVRYIHMYMYVKVVGHMKMYWVGRLWTNVIRTDVCLYSIIMFEYCTTFKIALTR